MYVTTKISLPETAKYLLTVTRDKDKNFYFEKMPRIYKTCGLTPR